MTAKKITKEVEEKINLIKKCYYCSNDIKKIDSSNMSYLCSSCGEDITVHFNFNSKNEITSVFMNVFNKGYVNTSFINKGHSLISVKRNNAFELDAELPDYFLATHSPEDVKAKIEGMALFA